MVTGVVRSFPILYYNQKARNATLNYLRAVPAVLQWIGAFYRFCLLNIIRAPL